MSQIITTPAKGGGSAKLLDFHTGVDGDIVSLLSYGFANFAAVQSAMLQNGSDVVLALGGGQMLTFAGHQLSDFSAANFGMAASDLHLAATFNPTTHQIHLTGDFVNSGSVLIYEALTGKPIGPGTNTGISTVARGTGTSFVSNFGVGADGNYTIQVIENGVVSQTTVSVVSAPVAPPASTTSAGTTPAAVPDMHLAATYDPKTHQIQLTGDFVNNGPVLIYEALVGKPIGLGTGTGISTVARGTGTSFMSKFGVFGGVEGTYTLQVVENGAVNQTTVTVAAAPVAPPNALHLTATFDAASHTIHIAGNFVNAGSVLIYEALTGKPIGPGTGTGISTIARGTGDTWFTNQVAAGIGTYTIQAIENGVVSTTTVTVDAAAPAKPAPPPAGQSTGGTSSAPTSAYTYAAVVPQASGGSDVVGVNLQNPGTAALGAREITFGQEFAPGQVPAGRLLQATINGVSVAVQMDVKATNPDGSVRMAVLTLQQPALAAGASAGVMLQLAPVGATQGPAVDIAALTSGGYDFTVDLGLHNADGSTTPFHIDAAQALAAALRNGTTSTWLSGPQATQVRIDVPVAGSLHVTFDITAYADGTTSTDVQFNNDIAMSQSGGRVNYDATIRQNGATVFAQSNIDQFQYQTWHKLIYSNGTPGVNVQHDTAAMARAGFIENYDPSTGVKTSLITDEVKAMAGTSTTVLGASSFGILGNAGIVQYMATTGGRPDIGPTTQANAIWLMTQNAQAQAYALAQADAAGSVPWHLYDPTTGTYLATTDRPTLWVDGRGGTGGTTGLTQQIPQYYSKTDPGSGWAIDPGHQPDLSYVAYLLTGNRYYLDQLNAQASYDILITAPSYRQNGENLVVNGMSQVRVQAWDLRELQEAALINPDNSALKAYFTQAVNNNFTNLLATIIPSATATQGEATGWLPGTYGTAGSMAPWQQDYFGQVVAMAAEQGNAQATQVLHWESNYLVGRFLQASNGFDPHDGVAYNMIVGTASGSLFQTWAEIEQAIAPSGLGANFSGQWAALEYPSYQAWALATLASDITVEQSPQAIQAYGWLQAHTQVNAAWQAASPLYDIVPRLADGNLLTASNVHLLSGSANQSVAYGNADQLVYDNGTGNTTITGGSGIDILFAGGGHDLLIGGAGDDFLFGGSGASTLSGGGGHNWLQAGNGGTLFNLAAADAAQDIIAGFVPGRDHLHVTGAGGAALTTPQMQSLIAGATAAGGNTTLTIAPNHTVTINNLAPGQLTSAVFA